jgi:hypothetical protein
MWNFLLFIKYKFGKSAPILDFLFELIASKSVFPGCLGVRKQRFPARRVFYFATETMGNRILKLVFNNVDRRKRQFTLNKMDVLSHLQL